MKGMGQCRCHVADSNKQIRSNSTTNDGERKADNAPRQDWIHERAEETLAEPS